MLLMGIIQVKIVILAYIMESLPCANHCTKVHELHYFINFQNNPIIHVFIYLAQARNCDLAKDEPDHTVLLRLTCPPGVRMLQGESQPIVNGSHLDNRLLHHHPVCVLNSKETLNTEGPMCLRPFKVVAKHPLSSSSGTNPQSTSELVFTLFSEHL